MLTWYSTQFGSWTVMFLNCGVPAWLVPRPCLALRLNQHIRCWRGLTGAALAKPYVALRTGQNSWVLLPHNSVQGQQILLTAGTFTQPAPYLYKGCPHMLLCAHKKSVIYLGSLKLGTIAALHLQLCKYSAVPQPGQASAASPQSWLKPANR